MSYWTPSEIDARLAANGARKRIQSIVDQLAYLDISLVQLPEAERTELVGRLVETLEESLRRVPVPKRAPVDAHEELAGQDGATSA
jgi:hypothetical protein